jgi:hypothetical protein
MPSLVPERPTLPPLRSLALPMHGVPSNMTLPGIHELCNNQVIPFLYLHVVIVLSFSQTSHRTLRMLQRSKLGSADVGNPSPPQHPHARRILHHLRLSPVPSHLLYTIQLHPNGSRRNIRILRNHMFALS